MLRRIVAVAAGHVLAALVLSSLGFGTLMYLSWEHVTTAPWPLQTAFALTCLVLLSAVLFVTGLWLMNSPPKQWGPRYWIWYKNPLRKVSWQPGALGVLVLRDNPAVISNFHCSFRINRGRIVPKRLYLEFIGGQKLDLRIGGKLAADYEHIPAGRWQQCDGRIVKSTNPPSHPSIDQFFATFGPFNLIFEYDDSVFRRTYPRAELMQSVKFMLQNVYPPLSPRANLRNSSDA